MFPAQYVEKNVKRKYDALYTPLKETTLIDSVHPALHPALIDVHREKSIKSTTCEDTSGSAPLLSRENSATPPNCPKNHSIDVDIFQSSSGSCDPDQVYDEEDNISDNLDDIDKLFPDLNSKWNSNWDVLAHLTTPLDMPDADSCTCIKKCPSQCGEHCKLCRYTASY